MRDVITLRLLKSPVKIDLDGTELTFTICIIIEQYEKRLTKIKNVLTGTRTTGQIISYGLMAAYTIPFYTLLSVNGWFCRLVKINFVFFTLKTLRASPVSINANTAGLSSCQKCRQTDRQTAFQLYIVEDSRLECFPCV